MRQKSKKIAITGGIGSGKSAVVDILRRNGYPVFSCDEIYSKIAQSEGYLCQLAQLFPDCVTSGKLDRKALSDKVFSDGNALNTLNNLAHPLIMQELFSRMQAHSLSFAEVPLLFEGGLEGFFDEVIVVMRDQNARIEAVRARDGLEKERIQARMQSQFDYSTLSREKFLVIDNDAGLSALEEQTLKIIRYLEEKQ